MLSTVFAELTGTGGGVVTEVLAWAVASYPGPSHSKERAWYPLFAHALNFPAFRGSRISPCDVRGTMTSIHIRGRIINRVRDNGYSCGRLGSFDFLSPPAPSMCSEGTETRTESVFEVHIRGEGRFRLFLWIYVRPSMVRVGR